MSYAHFYYVEKVDKRIVIDIAVNLAKKYIDDNQAKFINAILDKVLNRWSVKEISIVLTKLIVM